MHRLRSTAESKTSARLWLRNCGWPSLILAAVWAATGRLSFALDVDHVLVTPAFFLPEAFALAFVLRFGPGVWPGIFVGHQLLILGRDLPVMAGLGVSAANTLEALLAVWLFRRLGGKTDMYDVRSWALLQLIIFLVLQPFCAALGTGSLFATGVIGDHEAWKAAALNWWSGSGMAQSQIAPLLLVLLGRRDRVSWPRQIILPALVTAAVLAVALLALSRGGVGTSLVLFQPLLVAFALLLGIESVCVGSAIISVAFLYVTSQGMGPFYKGEATSLLDLDVFLIGISLIGQFLAVLFRQWTAKLELEKELQSANTKLQEAAYELTENIPVGTYTMVQPPNGGMAYFSFLSTRFLELTGLDREEAKLNPMNAFACVHPDDRDEWVRKNAYVFEHKLPFQEEGRIVLNGETRWIRAESRPRDLADGSVVWEGVLTDITAQKEAEQNLSEANLNMRLAATAARLGFWEFDVKTGLDRWDEEMARINGTTLAEFDGHWEKFVHPDDYNEVMRQTRQMIESDRIFQMEYRIVRPDGEVRHIREHGNVVRDKAGQPLRVSGAVQDITEQKDAATREKNLESRYRRDLETKLKSSLAAAAVAHEINQPLSAILLRTKMAIEQKQDGLGALSAVAEEAQRVVTTIEKMKTLMRNVQTEQSEFDLAAVVRSALLYNKGLLAQCDITARESGLDKSHLIMGDDAQVQLAITNILRNAAEAIVESATDRRQISVDLADNESEVILTIGDSGPGWSGAQLAETPLNTTKKGGTGIGLYVIRTTMENHGGEIGFGNSALGGAEVKMIFPRAATKES